MELLCESPGNRVPSTRAPDPSIHVFLDAGAGNILAFFELSSSPPTDRDEDTLEWTQHIAFKFKVLAALEWARRGAKAA